MASIGQFNEASCNQFNVLPLYMPILIVSCLILQLNLDPIIHMILRLHFIFVKSLVVNLCSLDNAFLDQELLIGGIIYHPHIV